MVSFSCYKGWKDFVIVFKFVVSVFYSCYYHHFIYDIMNSVAFYGISLAFYGIHWY